MASFICVRCIRTEAEDLDRFACYYVEGNDCICCGSHYQEDKFLKIPPSLVALVEPIQEKRALRGQNKDLVSYEEIANGWRRFFAELFDPESEGCLYSYMFAASGIRVFGDFDTTTEEDWDLAVLALNDSLASSESSGDESQESSPDSPSAQTSGGPPDAPKQHEVTGNRHDARTERETLIMCLLMLLLGFIANYKF